MLEAFADGNGGWNVMDVLGKPIIDLEEKLYEDLLTWRWLVDIARAQNRKRLTESEE